MPSIMVAETVQKMYDGGMSIQKISAAYGLDRSTVYYFMVRKDIPRRLPVRKLDDVVMIEIIKEYTTGSSILELTKKYDVCDSSLREALLKSQVKLRGRPSRRTTCKECGTTLLFKAYSSGSYKYFCVKCERARGILRNRSSKLEAISEYGGKCECCGETKWEFLTIDHLGGGGKKHRKELSGGNIYRWLKKHRYPKTDFRLLCINCNFAFGRYGYCPHVTQQIKSMSLRPDSVVTLN